MKKTTCLLLSFLIFITPILAQNPCEDETYLELKKKKLDEMSDREYEYFTRKDTEYAAYLSKTPPKSSKINDSNGTMKLLKTPKKQSQLNFSIGYWLSGGYIIYCYIDVTGNVIGSNNCK